MLSNLLREDEFYCPICKHWFWSSDYLETVFEGPDLWLANLVTHYRHSHRAWDNQWKYISRFCKDGTYEIEKAKVNNQIKRALLRGKETFAFIKENNIPAESFLKLQDNEPKTIDLINKKFER